MKKQIENIQVGSAGTTNSTTRASDDYRRVIMNKVILKYSTVLKNNK